MSENIVPFEKKALTSAVGGAFQDELSDDLMAGAGGGYGVVSIKGSKWHMKSGGESTTLLNDEGDPRASLEVVLVKASRDISKQYFAKKYSEGDDGAPDCLSIDGKKPDPAAANPQSDSCATCPHAQWGSRITENGKKAKACADSRRIAVVPAGDIQNEAHGGPMLLRIPAASLADLKKYGQLLKAKGFPYNTVVTRLGFDHNAAYPKLTFKAVRPLSDEELAEVAEVKGQEQVHHILYDAFEMVAEGERAPVAKNDSVDVSFETEASAPAPEVEAPKPKKAAPKKAAKPKEEPKPEAAAQGDDLDDDIDSIISDLEGLA